MVGLPFCAILIIIVAIQICPLIHASPEHPSAFRNVNSNVNANINSSHRKYRRNDASHEELHKDAARIIETAAIASAAADAAKIVTRSLTKQLSENTADAVADAVVRVLATNTSTPIKRVMKVARVALAARRNINANSNTNINVVGRKDVSRESLEDDDDIYARQDSLNATARDLDYEERGHERMEDEDFGAEDDDNYDDDSTNINLNSNTNINRMSRRFYNMGPWSSQYSRRSSLHSRRHAKSPEARFSRYY